MAIRTHQRDVIRNAIVDLLKDQIIEVESRVYPQRRTQIELKKLPCILVYTNSESVDRFDNVNSKRTIKLSIEIQAQGMDEIEVSNVLDLISTKIELIFLNDRYLIDLLDDSMLTNISEAFTDDDSIKMIGGLKMDFDLVYFTENVPDDITQELNKISANIKGFEVESDVEQ